MQSAFESACERAEAAIAVPPVPLQAIRRAASVRPATASFVPRLAFTAIAVLAAAGVAAAAELYLHSRVYIGPNGQTMLAANSGKFVPHPNARDLAAAARAATFHVVFPAAVPGGGRPMQMVATNDAIVLNYNLPGAWRRSDHLLWIMLVKRSALVNSNVNRATRRDYRVVVPIQPKARTTEIWDVGDEAVIAKADNITRAELDAMKRAMQR